MGFHVVNELHTFDFSQTEVYEIKRSRDQLILDLSDVMIFPENSCNTEYCKMGTNELTLSLSDISELAIVKDGYKIFDMKDNITEEKEDEIVPEEEFEALFATFAHCLLYELSLKDDVYTIGIDVDPEELLSYTLTVKASKNSAQWERFRRLPQDYK